MGKQTEVDGIDVELDDDIEETDLDQGAEARDDDAIDWQAVEAAAEDTSGEDDTADPYDDDGGDQT